jgi:hypothetical protein
MRSSFNSLVAFAILMTFGALSIADEPQFVGLANVYQSSSDPYWSEAGNWLARMDANGPIPGTLVRLPQDYSDVVVPPNGAFYYGIRGPEFHRINATTLAATEMTVSGGGVVDPGWYTSATYDSNRNRVVLASLSGTGYLMTYSLATQEWSLMAILNGDDLKAIVYRPENDTLYAIRETGSAREIYKYSANGNRIGTLTLPQSIPFTQGSQSLDWQFLLASDGQFAVIKPAYIPDSAGALTVQGSWLYLINPDTGVITYNGPLPMNVPEPGLLAVVVGGGVLLRRRTRRLSYK